MNSGGAVVRALLTGAGLVCFLAIGGCAVGFQESKTVLVRHPGERRFDEQQSSGPLTKELVPYAQFSARAYGNNEVRALTAGDVEDCWDIRGLLPDDAWDDWPASFQKDEDIRREQERLGLAFNVWESKRSSDSKRIVVAFRGTNFSSWADWFSNLRWFSWPLRFLPIYKDQYLAVNRGVAEAFVNELRDRSANWTAAQLQTVTIHVTGHSLGGGLAQHFAYALPQNSPWKVTRVVAFDPSPVTGWFSVAKDLRERNAAGLRIDRIYEHGEILAYARWLLGYLNPPAAANPAIWQVRYNYVRTWNPIASHSMTRLACSMERDVETVTPLGVSAGTSVAN